MRRAAIECDALDGAMGRQQNRATRRFIDAARLHADKAVLDQIEPADAVIVAVLIELGEELGRFHAAAVDRDSITLFESDGDVDRLVRRVHRRDGTLVDVGRRLDRRVLQHFALRRRVQQVRIDRERRLVALVLGDRDLVLLGEFQELFAALERPLTPRRDDLDRRLQRVVAEFEADLIVALACRTVANRIGAHHARNLDLPFGDQRPRNRRAEQIHALVDRIGPKHREHIIADEFLADVLDVNVLGFDAEQFGLLARRAQFFALAEISGEGDDLASVGLLQPLQNDRRIEPARIGEDDFFDFFRVGGHERTDHRQGVDLARI